MSGPVPKQISRRHVLRALRAAAGAPLVGPAFGQGRCRDGYATPACPLSADAATAPIKPVFAPTGWRTVALDHITFQMPDYRKEAAFYIALMGWKLRSDDGTQAVLDLGDWGSAIFRQAPEQRSATVENLCFVIEPWNADNVQAELRKRGLTPVAENDGKGFESFHVKDPDGLDLQIGNGNGLARARKTPACRARDAGAIRGHRMEDRMARPHLARRGQLQAKRLLLFQSPGVERDVRRRKPARAHDR